ncbi:MAG TPA: ATP-binding protein [Bacteroidales bacterium]|nr:ATP-binding protein [Bacteroidales bacterium]
MRIPKLKFHLSYQMIVWSLVSIALLLAGGYLIISYIYQLQENTRLLITENVISTRNAQELRLALYRVRAASLTHLFDKSDEQLKVVESEQKTFLGLLEKSGQSAQKEEEKKLISQISALFSNYEQTMRNAIEMHRQGKLSQPNALIVLASQDLINTIEEKTNTLIDIKEQTHAVLEKSIQTNDNIITVSIYSLGISGIIMGLILGWLIARIILNPIYKLVLKVRDAAGSEVVEHIRMTPGKELEELDLHINRLIGRISKANEDLRQNRELLERSARFAAIGRIAPALAHEIRNPLTSIKMLIHSLLNELQANQEQKDDLEIMLHEISRMEDFLQNFLKYARPAKPQLQTITPEDCIKPVLQLMQARFKQSNIEIETLVEDNSLTLRADPNMIKQVMLNLLNNAVEVMPKGGTIRIISRKEIIEPQLIPMLVIDVVDAGPGIPDEIRDTLFDPFVRAKEQGIGLGLSISQRIADLHHGYIKARNNTKKGACFSLFLPLDNVYKA